MSDLWRSCTAYLQCQIGQANANQEQTCSPHPFVTISRQTGAGGITIGEKLAAYLTENDRSSICSWTVFDKNLVQRVLEEYHLSLQLKQYMAEDTTSELQTFFEELLNLHPSDWSLVHKTSETIIHLAKSGSVILVGRGANLLTRKLPFGFHVRLIGSLRARLKHVQDYYDLNRKRALQFIEKQDKGRAAYVKKNFSENIDNPLLYDVVINTDSFSYEQAATLIGQQALEKGKPIAKKI